MSGPLVRAKYRALEISEKGEGRTVRLAPVNTRSQWDPEGSEENRSFWRSTPAGSLSLLFPGAVPDELAVGRVVYVDITPDADGAWSQDDVKLGHGGRMTFELKRYSKEPIAGWAPYTNAEFQAQIDNVHAARLLLGPVVERFQAQLVQRDAADLDAWDSRVVLPRWKLELTPTE